MNAPMKPQVTRRTQRADIAAKCPTCKRIAYMDADQVAGRVSVVCPNEACDFHGYVHQVEIIRGGPARAT